MRCSLRVGKEAAAANIFSEFDCDPSWPVHSAWKTKASSFLLVETCVGAGVLCLSVLRLGDGVFVKLSIGNISSLYPPRTVSGCSKQMQTESTKTMSKNKEQPSPLWKAVAPILLGICFKIVYLAKGQHPQCFSLFQRKNYKSSEIPFSPNHQ